MSRTALPTAMASGLPPKVEPWVPGVMPLAASAVARQAPSGKPPPMPLASAMMSGVDARPFIGEELAGAADAGLHLVEDEQQAVLVAERAELAQELAGDEADAALALDRLDHDRRGLGPDRRLDRLEVAERHLVEALGGGPKPSRYFGLPVAASVASVRPWKAPGEGDDARALGMAADELIAPRRLDGALDRFGAGIAEEDLVGEGLAHELGGERLLLGNAVEVGDVPELAGLLGQRLDQRRMGVAQRIDGDAAREIEQLRPSVVSSHAPSPRTKAIGARAKVSKRGEWSLFIACGPEADPFSKPKTKKCRRRAAPDPRPYIVPSR